MKKFLCLISMLCIALLLTACGSTAEKSAASTPPQQPESASTAPAPESSGSRTLVAYFSATGNTKVLAETAAAALGADLFAIEPTDPYTSADLNYNDKGSRSTVEQNDPASRPQIKNRIENLAQYDTIVIAYPIWWSEEPRIIDTFMESYDFSGKTLVPICTSGGSDIAQSAASISAVTTGAATWKDGRRFESGTRADDLRAYFGEIGILK
ncbi:flavodoxin [uncultured Selenomonas sp.]|uniref:flavodoxin n=1 Tax=uncultured Selenomonas sp. TaxID=159275 RepID=UPI002590C7BA|nr:flavodoxin [uncultured Selenomonas sp.]